MQITLKHKNSDLRYQLGEYALDSIEWGWDVDHRVEFYCVWSPWWHCQPAPCYWTLSMPACTSHSSHLPHTRLPQTANSENIWDMSRWRN